MNCKRARADRRRRLLSRRLFRHRPLPAAIVYLGVIAALALFGHRTLAAPAISQAQAQAAIDAWVKGPKGPSRDGSARVVSVRDGGSQNEAIAALRVKQFPDEDGHISPTEDPADGTFTRQKDGRWMLTKVVWDQGRRTANPNVAVK